MSGTHNQQIRFYKTIQEAQLLQTDRTAGCKAGKYVPVHSCLMVPVINFFST